MYTCSRPYWMIESTYNGSIEMQPFTEEQSDDSPSASLLQSERPAWEAAAPGGDVLQQQQVTIRHRAALPLWRMPTLTTAECYL